MSDGFDELFSWFKKQQPNRKKAIVLAACAVVLSTGSAVAYTASVRYQILQSYKAQESQALTDTIKVLEKGVSIKKEIDANPLSALGFLGEAMELRKERESAEKRANDARYAIEKNYGSSAYEEWRTENASEIQKITNLYNQAQGVQSSGQTSSGQTAETESDLQPPINAKSCNELGSGYTLRQAESKLGIRGELISSANIGGTVSKGYKFKSGNTSCIITIQNGLTMISVFEKF